MFCIAVCDSDLQFCSKIENFIESCTKNGGVQVSVFCSGEKLCDTLRHGGHFDLIFLEIELCTMNGIAAGRVIREEICDNRTQIVYISSDREHAMDLFQVRPMDFLIKPISKEKVAEAVEKAMFLLQSYDTCFELKKRNEFIRIPYADIVYFESRNRKIIVHTDAGEYETYQKLQDVESLVPPGFIRIHKSYLINRMHVFHCRSHEVMLSNGKILSISRQFRKEVSRELLSMHK